MRKQIEQIETAIQLDVGRGAAGLFAASRGGLWRAVDAFAAARPQHVGILTGFFVPQGTPPAAETDGPAGAALLALALTQIGVRCRLLTDATCRSACTAALSGAGLSGITVDGVPPDAPLGPVIDEWRSHGTDWMIAIERCGLSSDGRPRNMRGEDIAAHSAPLDHVFTAGPWSTIAIGDGGNEVGMGALPAGLIARDIPLGATIACVTPADHLITAGVSHWGVYALIGGLALRRPDWRASLLACLDPAVDARILQTLVENGPAVDGVTLQRTVTIDGIGPKGHRARMNAVIESIGADRRI